MLHKKSKGKNLYIVSGDVKSAFDKLLRSRMLNVFASKVGNHAFLHNYKNLLDNLLLEIALPFGMTDGIKSDSGSPQGLKLSAF